MFKLNLGCGEVKFSKYTNIDAFEGCKPDVQMDFIKTPLPYDDGSCDTIMLLDTLEYINKKHFARLFQDIWRALRKSGDVYITYPDFKTISTNWVNNEHGARSAWEIILYGRQQHEWDFVKSLVDPIELQELLTNLGFYRIEGIQHEMMVGLHAYKGEKMMTYEDVVSREIGDLAVQ